MTIRTPVRAITAAAAAIIMTAAPAAADACPPTQHEHTVTTEPAEGQFRCGELLLTVNGGTQTETVDSTLRGTLTHGVAHILIRRAYHAITLVGSDGRSYRASAHAWERVILRAPDFENPVWAHEVAMVTFYGGPHGSPGFVKENLTINHGVETDTVTGACDFAD
jgi:hypothetical protein